MSEFLNEVFSEDELMRYEKELIDAISSENFELTEQVLEKIIEEDDSIEYVSVILNQMEKNLDIDYGMPGPVVHFAERYYLRGYEKMLYESLKRKPTQHTLWMLNRILNSPQLVDKDTYLTLLNDIASDDSIDAAVSAEARSFFEYQKGTNGDLR